jgi:hypothetical protein
VLGESYEITGQVTLRNTRNRSWGIEDVMLEAVRPDGIVPVLQQSAR